MADLILELMSEEMPASILERSATNINQLITENIIKNNIIFGKSHFYFSPKRLTFIFEDIKPKENNIIIKGPSVSSPIKAIEGFANSLQVDIKSLIKRDTNKGEYYFFKKEISYKDINEECILYNTFPLV